MRRLALGVISLLVGRQRAPAAREHRMCVNLAKRAGSLEMAVDKFRGPRAGSRLADGPSRTPAIASTLPLTGRPRTARRRMQAGPAEILWPGAPG